MSNQNISITVQCTVNASIEQAWDYFTLPEHITQWNFASDDWHTPKAENDLRVGGKYFARMEAKDGSFGFDLIGIYDAITVHQLLDYHLEDGRKVNVQFQSTESGTEITETFDAETENSEELQRGGWQAILDNFKRYAEKTSASVA